MAKAKMWGYVWRDGTITSYEDDPRELAHNTIRQGTFYRETKIIAGCIAESQAYDTIEIFIYESGEVGTIGKHGAEDETGDESALRATFRRYPDLDTAIASITLRRE